MRTKLHLPAALAACIAALLAALPATGAERLPSAGAPHYLHWGDDGLCIPVTDWTTVSGITYDAATRVVAVEGKPNAPDFLEVTVDGHGTSSVWDDTVEITLESYLEQGPPDVETLDPPLPLYEPGDDGGGGGGWTTENTPKKLFLKRIEFLGSVTDANGVTNSSQIPMYARGFFGDHADVDGFFVGGSGPDCVNATTGKGAGLNNSIDGRGGADYIRAGFGDDSLTGGDGPDTIIGGDGDDVLRGVGDVDHLRGEGDSDCYIGGASDDPDGLRDLLDDPAPGWADVNQYIAEPGIVDGDQVETIDYITERNPLLVDFC
jgi:hypothetical protein